MEGSTKDKRLALFYLALKEKKENENIDHLIEAGYPVKFKIFKRGLRNYRIDSDNFNDKIGLVMKEELKELKEIWEEVFKHELI
jgi:hypothetical protein